ncbi:MAG: pyruvate, phosphate dikinase [Acidimicrobiales bacterium]
MRYVFAFDHKHKKPPMSLKDLLGGKGANLAEMTSVLALPVPPGFTISTKACQDYLSNGWPEGLTGEISRHCVLLEKTMGKRLGDLVEPLLVSVRSGAKYSMPGMMDSVLNLGLNDESVEGLAKQTNDERFALDTYRRFIAMYGRIVMGVDASHFERLLEIAKDWDGVSSDAEISVDTLRRLVRRSKEVVESASGLPFPQDPTEQLRGAVEAVFHSWDSPRALVYRNREGIDHDLGTAVNVQSMVFGNRDEQSGTGVGFTRNPSTGEAVAYGDVLINAQGEDVVSGIRNTEPIAVLSEKFPLVHKELIKTFRRLECHYRDMCDVEFTIEQGKLWILQTRVGKRTGLAALRIAIDLTRDRAIKLTRSEAVQRITPEHLDALLHPQFGSDESRTVLTTGLGASPGAAVGQVYFSAEAVEDAVTRGERAILVRNETSPEDIHGMAVAEGVLTARGGLVSHAAVVARGWGKPAVCGAEALLIAGSSFSVGDVVVSEGEVISLDGTTGEVFFGACSFISQEAPPELATILSWADKIRGKRVQIRANADTAADALRARGFGAEGIGLCRTEHMFLGEDRLPIVRAMILAETAHEETQALKALYDAQKADFLEILEAMNGLPVNVRLLDPPLHEFLPDIEELSVKEATVGLSKDEVNLLRAARAWHEVNPMLGTRGVRLGVIKPGLYAMQVRALVAAARERLMAKGKPIIEIMIPLTVSREELALARGWVEEAIVEAATDVASRLVISIGTMIETPRAALMADELGEVADFFSFGTNDLTQMTFGFSRDDIEGRIMGPYLGMALLDDNPFETIDVQGVGELVRLACDRGRSSNPDLKLGICGEHGGDPTSIGFFVGAGLDYVSCSPFRVPIARLSVAQCLIAEDNLIS